MFHPYTSLRKSPRRVDELEFFLLPSAFEALRMFRSESLRSSDREIPRVTPCRCRCKRVYEIRSIHGSMVFPMRLFEWKALGNDLSDFMRKSTKFINGSGPRIFCRTPRPQALLISLIPGFQIPLISHPVENFTQAGKRTSRQAVARSSNFVLWVDSSGRGGGPN